MSEDPSAKEAADRDTVKRYSNGEITVVWQPSLCVHSAICARGLPRVFDPRRRPWVILDGFDSATITDQVERCPSGALSIEFNTPEKGTSEGL